jgi:ABC-type phosphate transport system permease subunit
MSIADCFKVLLGVPLTVIGIWGFCVFVMIGG